MTKKKMVNKPNIPKLPQKKLHPILILFIVAFIIALLIPGLKQSELYKDSEVALNTLEQNYLSGAYKSIEINENKAIATLS